MLSLYCKATKLLPGTVDMLSFPIPPGVSYVTLSLILQRSMARPFRNKRKDSASAEGIIDSFYLDENY